MLNVVEGIRTAAGNNAFAPALITAVRVINYSDLLGLVARISNDLTDRGVKPGARLFLNIDDPDLRIITMVAAMHAGLVPFTLLQLGEDKDDIGYDLVVGVGAPFIRDLACDFTIDQGVLVGPKGDPKLRDFPERGDDDVLYVVSTTGTTGRRKLQAITRGRYLRPRPGTPLNYGPGDRIMVTLGGMTASAVGHCLRIMRSGATHVRSMPNVADRLKLINLTGVTRLHTTPETLAEMIDLMETVGVRCPSIKWMSLTGNLIPARLVERIERNFDAETRVSYGTTEAGGISSGVLRAATFEPGYVGELFPGLTIVGAGTPENPKPLMIVNNRAGPAADFRRGQVIATGGRTHTLPDLGFVRGNSLFIVGRDDEVFNVDGNKVAFSVLDRDLRRMPAVKDVGIVGGDTLGHPGQLFVAVVADAAADLGALRAIVERALKAPLGDHVHLFRLASIPRNAMGKVDRMAVVQARRGNSAEP